MTGTDLAKHLSPHSRKQTQPQDRSPSRTRSCRTEPSGDTRAREVAGKHLLLDIWQSDHLRDETRIRDALVDAAEFAGATVLKLFSHRFSFEGGITAVVVLAESHISIHTWPERDYAAIDIFMCGDARPHDAAKRLIELLEPARSEISEHLRGKKTG